MTLTISIQVDDHRRAILHIKRGTIGIITHVNAPQDDTEWGAIICNAKRLLEEAEARTPAIVQITPAPTPAKTPDKPKTAAKASKPAQTPPAAPVEDLEPTIDIPIAGGKTRPIRISALTVANDGDATAYKLAGMVAGKLFDAKLWNGTDPIVVSDAYKAFATVKHFNGAELAKMYTLEDLVSLKSSIVEASHIDEPDEEAEADVA